MPFSENEPQCCRQETHPRRLQETHAGEPATSENSEVDEEAAEGRTQDLVLQQAEVDGGACTTPQPQRQSPSDATLEP